MKKGYEDKAKLKGGFAKKGKKTLKKGYKKDNAAEEKLETK